jgi:hypothetical protein
MRFEKFSFGSIRIDGTIYKHDVVIDRGQIRKRKKEPSKKFRDTFGHTPLSIEESRICSIRRFSILLIPRTHKTGSLGHFANRGSEADSAHR